MLTRDDLVAVFPPPKTPAPRAIWDAYAAAILSPQGLKLLSDYGISTPLRLAHLFGTWGAENGLRIIWESGAYSADGIVRVFGAGRHSAAIGMAEAQRIASLPVDERTRVLFERVYGTGNPKKARELGNTQPGDGWRCRGLGLNQATGRAAQEAACREIGCSLEDLCHPINLMHMALIEWDEKDCNGYADRDDAVSIRKLINGGSLKVSLSRINGLPEALAVVRRAKRVIDATDFETPPRTNVVACETAPPPTILHSTEAQAAATTGGGGAVSLYQGTQNSVMRAASSGELTVRAVLLAMLAEPLVWAGVAALLGAGYLLAKRWARFVREGT